MAKVIEIPVEPLTGDEFAPFGEIIGPAPWRVPDWERPGLRMWRFDFESDAPTRLQVMRYMHQPMAFHHLERHVCVTEGRIPLGGVRAVMVVAPPTPLDDPAGHPDPGSLRAFLLDGRRGIMLRRGTWHALDCFPVEPPHADFGFLSDVETENEIELTAAAVTRERTHVTDYLEHSDLSFVIIDPRGVCERAGSSALGTV